MLIESLGEAAFVTKQKKDLSRESNRPNGLSNRDRLSVSSLLRPAGRKV